MGRGSWLQGRLEGWGCHSQNQCSPCSQNPPHSPYGSGYPSRSFVYTHHASTRVSGEFSLLSSFQVQLNNFSLPVPWLGGMKENEEGAKTLVWPGHPFDEDEFSGESSSFLFIFPLGSLVWEHSLHFYDLKKNLGYPGVPSQLYLHSLSSPFKVTKWHVTFQQGCYQFC